MTADHDLAGSARGPEGYIRGGGGVEIGWRRVVLFAALLCLVILAALVAVLTSEAIDKHARNSQLERHGVPVTIVVSRCLGLASGTGITVYAYQCDGTFALGGRNYTDVIGGTNAFHRPGDVIQGVTDPAHPANLATADFVARTHVGWGSLRPPGVCLVLLVLGAVTLWRYRRWA